jgi:hypothetical protein
MGQPIGRLYRFRWRLPGRARAASWCCRGIRTKGLVVQLRGPVTLSEHQSYGRGNPAAVHPSAASEHARPPLRVELAPAGLLGPMVPFGRAVCPYRRRPVRRRLVARGRDKTDASLTPTDMASV